MNTLPWKRKIPLIQRNRPTVKADVPLSSILMLTKEALISIMLKVILQIELSESKFEHFQSIYYLMSSSGNSSKGCVTFSEAEGLKEEKDLFVHLAAVVLWFCGVFS